MLILNGDQKLSTEKIMSLIGKINALIYARVSTTDQANKGFSIDSQIERCKERAIKKFGYKESEIIVLVEPGGMGDDPNRPALNHALYLLERGLGKKFIVLHPDRLTRDNTLQGVVSRRIWGMGVDIEFIEFEVNPHDPESMLMYNIQGSIAQYNKAKIHANSKRGRLAKAKKGELPSFKRLYGYKFNTKTDLPEYHEDEKEILLEMKDMLINKKMSSNDIAKELSRRGVAAPNGKTWYQSTVSRMLQNEDYTGNYYYGKSKVVQLNGKKKQVPTPKEEWILIKIPAMWDHQTREQIIKQMKLNFKGRSRSSRDYLLKGKAKCGRCGGACGSGITSKTKSGVYKYYSCRNKNVKGYQNGKKICTCKGKNWRVDIVDDAFWKWFKKLLSNPEEFLEQFLVETSNEKKIEELENKKEKLDKQLEDIDSEISNYVILFGKGKINEDMFDKITQPLELNKEHIKNEIEILNSHLSANKQDNDKNQKLIEYINSFSEMITKDISMHEKRQFLDFFIEKVTLFDDDHMEIVWKGAGLNDSDQVDFLNSEQGGEFSNSHKRLNHIQAYGRQTA
ncbi:recombinase family protein [Bacillus atrophaeus]|uniref:recombinase family protein n=1 Tax=Bacillus atrophaeus TaxID=1452 RepID=UPI002281FAF3|nr:recombinase family protein [Bacillus atrophaeus]MCY7948062.1 recombinase family protein [Bacillus atrophaeus]MCY8098574.1 recombinase family protein [Bacillus atrophaeus]MCY9167869.1 recombinase family protein [Bacillus atrophaeus]MEC0741808.1 recombinase family protein [Bacillus atrophaeus]MEC0744878.1 recombinase family protein [Bacillus atrophaeus]